MKIKFLADASLSESIVNGVLRKEPSIDFLDANSARLESVSDDEVLAIRPGKPGYSLLTF